MSNVRLAQNDCAPVQLLNTFSRHWRCLMFAQVTIASSTPFRTTVEMIDFENLSMPQVMMRYKHQCVSRAPGGFAPGTQNLSG
jgi:hypothetical protein